MNIKKYRIPALPLAALIAFVMMFTMGVTVQKVYADDGAEGLIEYDIEIGGVKDLVPGDTMDLQATVKKGETVVPLPEGSRIEWGLGELGPDKLKERYILPKSEADGNRNPDEYVQVMTADTTKAQVVSWNEGSIEKSIDTAMGISAELINAEGVVIGRSDSHQFRFAAEFNSVEYKPDGIDPNLLSGQTQDITVMIMHHERELIVPLEVRYEWTFDSNAVQILCDGEPVTGTIVGQNKKFTFKRINSKIESEPELSVYDNKSGELLEAVCFPLYAISNDLADYQIEFNGSAEDPFVFVDKSDLPITKDSEACKITVVSGNGDGHIVPPECYKLKIQKVIGYNETTWDEILQPADFPLDVDPIGTSSLNGDRTEGTAQYLITAVAESGSAYIGQTGSGTGGLWLLDRKTMTWPAVSAGFPDKNYNIYQFRYEVKKGKKLTPFATSIETLQNLTMNKDYSVRYINKKTNKVYTSFPTKLGEYTVVFSGISPYYGQQDGIDLMIGKKNPVKAKGKTIICKTKMKKGKTKKAKSFNASKAVKVTKAKGTVSYIKVSGNKNITVSDSGKIKVKKGTKKGTYKVKIEVTAQGTSTYIAGTKKVTVKIKVK